MDQVSRPMLIVLAATIVLAALWLVALRPKPPEVEDTPAAPVTAISKAKAAAAAANAANAKLAGVADGAGAEAPSAAAAPTTGGTSAPAAPAAPAAAAVKAANDRDATVVRDIEAGKVVVMLFWNAKGADDAATRNAVRAISRHHGKVAVHVVPISRVGQYESITQNVTVNQSPTTIVIDKKRRSRAIVGLTEKGELSQAVNDALAGRL